MKVGCCSIRFVLHGNRSLKGKRRIVSTIKSRVKNKFNISVAEVGDQDEWQRLHLGIAAIGGNGFNLDGLLNQVVDFIDAMGLAEMTGHQIKLINLGKAATESL
ncbi:MAG: DUF503 domain-containing protein [Nitrospinales bacterium]